MVNKIAKAMLGSVRARIEIYMGLMVAFRNAGFPRLAKLASYRLHKYGVHISPNARFHPSLKLAHPVGVVIGDGVIIGAGVKIYQNVTLGGARIGDQEKNNYPEIGDHSIIFAGAVVVGKVRIGSHCVIGANAVVTRDVRDYATAAGIPAREIANSNLPKTS